MRGSKIVIKDNYITIPYKIYHMGYDYRIITVYSFYKSLPKNFHPSLTYTAKVLKMSRVTVVKVNKQLMELNIIRLVKRGYVIMTIQNDGKKKRSGEATQYELVESKYWKELTNEH